MSRSPRTLLILALAAFWRRRTMFAVPLVVMPILGLVAALVMPKNYETRMTLLVQEPTTVNPIMRDLSIESNVKNRLPALQALLRSEHILGAVAADIGLIGPKATDRERERAVKALSGAVSMQLVGNELLELRMRSSKSAGLGRDLEAVSRRLIERLVAPELTAVSESEKFLKQQLDQKRIQVETAEKALADFKSENADRLPALFTTDVTRIAGMRTKLQEKTMELAAAEAAFSEIRNRLTSTNPVIGHIEQSMVQVSGELANLRARYTSDHSEVIAAERKLQSLAEQRRRLMEEAKSIDTTDLDRLWNMAAGMVQSDKAAPPLLVSQMQGIQEAMARRATLREEVEQLTKAINESQKSIAQFAPIEQRQQNLEKTLAVARENFDALSKRYEMTRVTGALGQFGMPERIKIIDAPADPSAPNSPPAILFILAGLVGALLLGAGLATVTEVLDPTLRQASDFSAILGVPVLARLPAR